jgi:hypothetical protein
MPSVRIHFGVVVSRGALVVGTDEVMLGVIGCVVLLGVVSVLLLAVGV